MMLKPFRSPMFLSLVLYGVSLALPTFEFLNRGQFNHVAEGTLTTMYGLEVLAIGLLGIFCWQFAWIANVIYVICLGLWLGRRWRPTLVLGMITIAMGLNTLFLFMQEIPSNGAGATIQLHTLQGGFYCWMISLSIPMLWSSWQLRRTFTAMRS